MKHERYYSAPFALFLHNKSFMQSIHNLTLIFALALLTACGDTTEVATNVNDNTDNAAPVYLGPAPLTTEVQAFKTEFWDKLSATNRCGQCHTSGGPAANFAFVDLQDVNVAYTQATSTNSQGQLLVDRNNPSNSRVILRVGEGHNCWEGNPDSVCASIVEGYIDNWLSGGTSSSSGRSIVLDPLIDTVAPGNSKNFPADALTGSPNFATSIYPILTANCAACHSEASSTPQSPFFASPDVEAAYEAAKSKIDLDTPASSRFVTRILELHNCWTPSCTIDAAEMETAIDSFANAITATVIDANLITSKAVTFADATLASGGNRYENDQIALWEFKTGEGDEAFDSSGIEPAMKLTFSGPVSWILGYGINFSNGGKAQASTVTSKKLTDLITLTNAYSIEAWIIPGNVTQEDARIISYSAGDTARNFSLSQTLYNYEFLNRSSNTDAEGRASLMTNPDDEDLQAALQHVVVTYDAVNGRRVYVNGVFTDDTDPTGTQGGSLIDWNDSYAFVLGNEVSGTANAWNGTLRMVAIHNRALTQNQITQNFSIGVGQKYFMLFSIRERLGLSVPATGEPDLGPYILFQAEQFDNTAYLFKEPVFVSLDNTYSPASNIPLQGMRIGVNGREVTSGQVYGSIDTNIASANYDINGQALSRLGTVIAVEKGPDTDEFFLTFETLGSNTNPLVEADPTPPAAAADAAPVSDIGVKTFDEINASMSFVTGISTADPAIASTFETYKQQLPSVENILAFLSSHQMGIAQLAMGYCNALVSKDKALVINDINRIFLGFDFTLTALNAFNTTAKKDQIIDPLLTGLMNLDPANPLSTQPDEMVIKDLLGSTATQVLINHVANDAHKLPDLQVDPDHSYESLMTTMTLCGGTGEPACVDIDTVKRTEDIVIATCAATLGSAMMLIQ